MTISLTKNDDYYPDFKNYKTDIFYFNVESDYSSGYSSSQFTLSSDTFETTNTLNPKPSIITLSSNGLKTFRVTASDSASDITVDLDYIEAGISLEDLSGNSLKVIDNGFLRIRSNQIYVSNENVECFIDSLLQTPSCGYTVLSDADIDSLYVVHRYEGNRVESNAIDDGKLPLVINTNRALTLNYSTPSFAMVSLNNSIDLVHKFNDGSFAIKRNYFDYRVDSLPSYISEEIEADTAMTSLNVQISGLKTNYSLIVDWGDGSPLEIIDNVSSVTSKINLSHTYQADGVYTIKYSGLNY